MKALVIEAVGQTRLCEVEPPEPGPRDVLVEVTVVGLCGSDLNTFRGLNPLVALPRIPGHEVSGRIIAKGAEVGDAVRLGQQVIVWPYTACGHCKSCRADRGYACRSNQTLGVQRDGALLDRLVAPAASVIPNDTLPPRLQALVEPISVGFHAAARGRVSAGEWVVVLGCGMIGVGAILAAAARGARVIAVDPLIEKQKAALDMGAEIFTPLTGAALLDEINRITDGDGADVVIEAVGLPETFTLAIDAAAFCGRVVYVGYSKAHVTYDTRKFNLKELDILGSRNASRADFEAVIARLTSLGEVAHALISRVFPLSEAELAFPYWSHHRSSVMKIMVEP